MDYEQKYKEALERAREYWKTDNDNTLDIKAKGTMEYLFPELREIEDEKVRKWLYGYFRSCFPVWIHPDITCEEILAWLENIPYTIDKEKREGFHLGYKAGLEKQGGQKPTEWSEEDEKILQWIITDIKRLINDNKKANVVANKELDWLITIKQRIGE